MAYDRWEKFPEGNTALLAGATVTFNLPTTFRHHSHSFIASANLAGGGAAVTDIAGIIDTIEYQLVGRPFIAPLTVAQHRYRQDTYSPDKYSGNRTNVLIINFREWHDEIAQDQDVHSIATANVASFVAKIKFKTGIENISLVENSRIVCDDGITFDTAGKPVVMPLVMTRTVEKFSVQNSYAGQFVLPQFDLRGGAFKRFTFEDGGKIDLVEVIHNKSVVMDIPREVMKSWMLDHVGLSDTIAQTGQRFTIPIDYLNRGLSGLGMRNTDGSRTDIQFRLKTNAAGGFDGLVERVENPLNTAA